jgi:hypothetical protein
MKQQITTKQLLSLNRLLNNIKDFSDSGFGNINDLEVLSYNPNKENIYVKFEKIFQESGSIKVEYPIASIDYNGQIVFIENQFKDIFQRSAFFSECTKIDIENPNDYEKID